MISFGLTDDIRERVAFVRGVAGDAHAPAAREFDEREHQIPWDFVNAMWDVTLKTGQSFRSGTTAGRRAAPSRSPSSTSSRPCPGATPASTCAGPAPAWAAPPCEATGTAEQKQRFLTRYREGRRSGPAWP